MIKSERADREKICVLMKAFFRRNTLCIARKKDDIRAQIFRKMPQAIYSAFTQVQRQLRAVGVRAGGRDGPGPEGGSAVSPGGG